DELLHAWPGAVLVALDCDDKGRKAAPQLAAQLRSAGREVRALDLQLGAKQDLADFCALRNGTSAADLAACADLALPTPLIATLGGRPAWLLDEDAVDQLRDPVWLVRDVLVAGEVTVVYGPSDAGKTFVVMDLTLRVAQHYPVLYVAAEDARGIKRRKQAWQRHNQLANTGRFFLRDSVLDLLDANQIDEFIAGARAVAPQLIVLDTLSQCVPGADENSARDMSVAMAAAQRIAHTLDTAVVLIHHTTKEGGNYRGSGTIKGNTYGMLEVNKDDDLIELHTERIKNSQAGKPRFFKLVPVALGSDAQGEPITSCVLAPAGKVLRGDKLTTNELKILEALAHMTDAVGGARTTELLGETLLPKGKSFYKPLSALRGLGLVEKGAKHTDPLVITEAGRARLARESADPTYQPAGTPTSAAVAFEVNTTLHTRTPASNDQGSSVGSNEGSNGGSSLGSNAGGSEGSNAGSIAPPRVASQEVATLPKTPYSASQIDATPCYPNATPGGGSAPLLPSPPPALAGEKGSNDDDQDDTISRADVSQPASTAPAQKQLSASPAVPPLNQVAPRSAREHEPA
ncbi:MAG: AAA family ATPase, partial [Chloroflexales bacterium]|nr:AAA family ATPase [Chloroflexales bacterium]